MSTEIGMAVRPKKNLTFSKCLEMGLDKHMGTITKVAEVAGKEYSIEQVKCLLHKIYICVFFLKGWGVKTQLTWRMFLQS